MPRVPRSFLAAAAFGGLYGVGVARAEESTPAKPAPAIVRSEDAAAPEKLPLDPRRLEFAGFPIIGGNSDIGVQFGATGTLTRFYDNVFPYLWNIDLLLSGSVKNEEGSLDLIQQSHVLRLDAPDLFGGKVRLDARLSYQRTINQGYYGLGNASSADLPPGVALARQFQYIQQEARARFISRYHLPTKGVDLAFAGNFRWEAPNVYANSQLAHDATILNPDGSRLVRGVDPMGLVGVATGVMIDTRDNEFITTKGFFYQVGVGATAGSADGVVYGQASLVAAHYARLFGPFIFASRIVVDYQFGAPPFYDLMQGGIFEPQYLLGAENGVRGVPQGRYAGQAKVVTNNEIRVPFPRFRFLGQRLRLGMTTFFDAGRVWSNYPPGMSKDGLTLGLKYGVGVGTFVQWGEAAIFRVEVAYSPDAVAENPGFPVGIYVSDGVMF